MKILYFYQYFTVPEGSYSTRVYEFSRRWAKTGDTVTVITSVYDRSGITPQGWISRFNVEGIDVRMINIRLSNKHGKLFRLFTFAAYALISSWYALVLPADVVVASSGPLTIGLPGLVARYLRRRPLVFEVRDLWPEGAIQLGILTNKVAIGMARYFERICYRAATKVIALSEGMAGEIRERYGFQHIEVIPNASDNELVDSISDPIVLPEWAQEKHLAVYAGALGLIDDCGQILDVAGIIQKREISDIEVVIIGSGKERAELEEKARTLKLEHIHFLGPMSKANVMRWLQAASCSLFTVKDVPFLATASPNKVFDSFAAGLPVVQATQGWIKDLIEREQCGINVPANDLEAMADAVISLAYDEQRRETLSANARRVARELFDRSLLAIKMQKILSSAAKEPTKGHAVYDVPDEV